ncbi:MAG: PilZ domain-containing protein [Deltaproteobacteria bacterium]|nr:PilZ domain-containing protein [Deltaproteobacteria bacterium]
MTEERRRHERYDIAAQIRVKNGRVNYIMDVANISLSGVFVRCEELSQLPWFRVDQEVDLDLFSFENLDNLSLRGQIVRVVGEQGPGHAGFGVQFVNLTVEAHDKLFELVATAARLSAEPPPLPAAGGNRGEEP